MEPKREEPEVITVFPREEDESGGGGGDGGFIGGGFGGGPSAEIPLDTPGDPDVIGGPVAREETSEERWTRWESYMGPALWGGIKAVGAAILLGIAAGAVPWGTLPVVMITGAAGSLAGDEGKWWWDKLTAEDQQNVQKLMNGAATASANALAALPASELRVDNKDKLEQVGFDAAKTFIGNELGKPGWVRISNLPSQLPKQPPPVVAPQVVPPRPAPAVPTVPVVQRPRIVIVKPKPGPRPHDR